MTEVLGLTSSFLTGFFSFIITTAPGALAYFMCMLAWPLLYYLQKRMNPLGRVVWLTGLSYSEIDRIDEFLGAAVALTGCTAQIVWLTLTVTEPDLTVRGKGALFPYKVPQMSAVVKSLTTWLVVFIAAETVWLSIGVLSIVVECVVNACRWMQRERERSPEKDD